MLNKLSFNLMNELNESETKAIQIKKKVFMEGSDVRVEELKEEKNYVLTEDASSALDSVISGDEVYFRDPDGVAMVVRYSENYQNPEDYDEGYKSEYGGDPEELEAAKQAAEEGNVWEFVEVDDDGTETGTVYNIVYGKEELRRMLEDLREVKMIKKLEDGQIEDAKADSIEKGLYSEGEKICKECNKPLSECKCKKDKVEEAAPVDTSKEDRLASLKTQLDKDGDQLADDEKKAIEDEIASIEKELEEGCNKSLKEDSYDDTFFSDIESALTSAGFDVTRFNDAGVLTKNLGWIVSNEEGEVQLSCDGTWLDESNLNEDDYEMARPWSTALIKHCENYGADIVWEETLKSLVKFLPDDRIKEFCKSEFQVLSPEEIDSEDEIEEGCNKSLTEKYVETFGGDSEDFVSDVETIKSTLEGINTDSFGTKLAQQMVWDWIETCDYQIEKGNRLTKGEFNESALTEGFKLGEKAEILDTCERRGQPIALVKLQKNGDEYVVAFGYTIENDEVSWDYGYYYYNEESGKEAFEKVKAGGNLSESEEKLIVEAAETEVKDLQVIKEQGNVYMLEDKSEGTRYIVGENYNLSEGEIENAEIYENKEEADKDYLDRCEIMKDGEKLDAGNEETADIE